MSSPSLQRMSSPVRTLSTAPDSEGLELAICTPLPPSQSVLSFATSSASDSVASTIHLDILGETQTTGNESSLPPGDRGLGAWSFLAAAFVVETVIWGIPNAFGVLLDAYLEDPFYSSQPKAASLLPLIGPVSSGMMYCSTAFLNLQISHKPKLRQPLLLAGTIICCASIIGASYADKIIQLLLLQGVLYAIGGSLLYSTTLSFLNEWFIARRGLANGIAFAGTSCGGLILPLVLPILLSRYGISVTLRILGVGTAILLFPVLPFLKGRLPHAQVRGPEPRGGRNHVLRDRNFLVLLLVNSLQGFAYFLPIVWLPTFANDLHVSKTSSSLALALLNGASVVGRLVMGFLADKLNPWILASSMLFLTSLVTFILWGVLANTLPGLLAFGIAYGALAAGWSSTWTGFVRRVMKDENPMGATALLGYLLFSRGVGNICSTPISSLLSRSPSNATMVRGAHTGFDVGEGRFGKMIVYVGTCFAVASGVAMFGWGLEMKGEQSRARASRLRVSTD